MQASSAWFKNEETAKMPLPWSFSTSTCSDAPVAYVFMSMIRDARAALTCGTSLTDASSKKSDMSGTSDRDEPSWSVETRARRTKSSASWETRAATKSTLLPPHILPSPEKRNFDSFGASTHASACSRTSRSPRRTFFVVTRPRPRPSRKTTLTGPTTVPLTTVAFSSPASAPFASAASAQNTLQGLSQRSSRRPPIPTL
mmetsp:Transcript_14533/g.48725  ORF Transcript_14533/g.48725 Transcript_14533/m.48725 type:complete len:200 (+) Transcript_14533:199-798(+)